MFFKCLVVLASSFMRNIPCTSVYLACQNLHFFTQSTFSVFIYFLLLLLSIRFVSDKFMIFMELFNYFFFLCRSKWINFEPFTNVLWLHYLLDKCLKAVYYHRKNTKVHKKYTNILKVWFNEVMESSSATHFVTHKNYC